MAWFAEMRRRNVLKVALLYAVLSWLIVWFVGAIQSDVIVPAWTETFVYFVLAVGFPVALWFAWTYEITPGGLRKAVDVDQTQSIVYKTGQKLNAAVAVLLVLGVLAVFGQRLLPKFEFLAPLIPSLVLYGIATLFWNLDGFPAWGTSYSRKGRPPSWTRSCACIVTSTGRASLSARW